MKRTVDTFLKIDKVSNVIGQKLEHHPNWNIDNCVLVIVHKLSRFQLTK